VKVELHASNKYQLFSGKRSRSPILEIDSWMRRAQAAQTRLQLLLNSGLKPAIEPSARMAALPVGPAQVTPGTLQYSIVISITYADQYLV
jgi:hypothetical protein